MIYLACPYTHEHVSVREYRVAVAAEVVVMLWDAGLTVYSPLTHGDAMVQRVPEVEGRSHEWWMRHCLEFVRRSSEVYVLALGGWDSSRGVLQELAEAERLGLPVRGVLWDDDGRSMTVCDRLGVPVKH